MGHRHGPVTASLAVALTVLLGAGPAAARLPMDVAIRSVPSQTRPDLVVLAVPTGPAAEETAARVDFAFRQVVEKSGRFDLARLIDLLDAENAKAREGRVEVGDKALENAKKLYNELDTVKALAEADRAIKAYTETDLTQHMPELVGAWIFKIASLVANGENKAAQLEMERLLVMDPDAQFSSNYFPPEDIAYAEKTRKAVKAADQQLKVTTVPTGAEVYVDGRFRGVAPVTVSGLAAGEHYVSAKAPGYSLAQQKARPGEVELTLRKSEAWPRYQAVIDQVKQDPLGEGRDRAAQEFGTWAGVEQVMLAVVDVPPGTNKATVTALRLDAKDGHNDAYAQEQLPVGEGAVDQAQALAAKLLERDEPRKRGAPVTHFAQAGGGSGKKIAGYVLLGTGAALLAGGVFFGLQANAQSARFRAMPQTDVRAGAVASTGRTYALIADLSYLTGLIAAGTGGYLAFAPQRGAPDKRRPGPGADDGRRADDERAKADRERVAEEERRKKEKEEEARKKKAAEEEREEDDDDLRNY